MLDIQTEWQDRYGELPEQAKALLVVGSLRAEDSYEDKRNETPIDKAEYINFRDDRVLTYFDMRYHGKMKFKVVLNAMYVGQFYLPTVYCEAMYDHDINASEGGKWVKVIK